MDYIQYLTLDLNTNNAYAIASAKQGDNARKINISVTEDGQPYTIPEGTTVQYRVHKPDGTAVWNTGSRLDSHTVQITLSTQCLTVAGRAYADVVLTNGSSRLSLMSFILIIQSIPNISGQVTSSDDFEYLQGVVDDAETTIQESEAWAAGTRGGAAVISTDSTTFTKSSSLYSVSVDADDFREAVGTHAGFVITYIFTYDGTNWLLEDNIVTLSDYGISISGGQASADDTISVTQQDKDLQADNNSKYYSTQSNLWANYEGTDTSVVQYHNSAKYWASQGSSNVEESKNWANYLGSDTSKEQYENSSKWYSQQSQAWSTGKIGSADVPSGKDQYQNNAKYWSTQAKSWAQGGTAARTGEDENNASYWNTQAQAAKTDAETAKTNAQTAQTAAESARDTANSAKDAALSAKTAAETAQGFAEDAQEAAEGSATAASQSATAASGSQVSCATNAAQADLWATYMGTDTTKEQYHNSAKYWCTQAQTAAEGITDVTYNGSSIVTNKVANIPAIKWGEVTEKPLGTANGVATLGSDGKVPASQLPSYVDDVIEAANYASLPETGEDGKIYITLDDNKTYRWSGSAYVVIGSSLALGTTHATAAYGDEGAAAYAHSNIADGTNPHGTTFANIASKPTTISGFGITDAYTKTEMDTVLDDKADATDIPTKTSELTNDSGFLTEHQSLTNYYTKTETDSAISAKQDKLVSDNNVIYPLYVDEGELRLGYGNGLHKATDTGYLEVEVNTGLSLSASGISVDTSTIQEKLVSGTSIKTINNNSLLGSGNIAVQEAITSSTDLTVKTLTGGLTYVTTAPTAANTDGLKFVVLSAEPATKYSGWIYLITE